MATPRLSGVRILSLAEQYPGPYATMLLADLGADVVMVERPAGGDPSRRFPGLFASFNRNKRSVALDLKSDAGRDAFLRLVDGADVVLEGYRPGVMARLGIGAELLCARKPGLIFVSISSFGQSGPRAGVAGHDLSVQAAAGMIDVAPGAEADFALPMLPLGDIASAMFAALGVVSALFARGKTGAGAQIDVSMLDALASWMTPFLVPPANGWPTRELPPPDPGYGVFATACGRQITLSIAGEDAMWSQLCDLIGLSEYAALREVERCARSKEIGPHVRAAVARCDYDTLYRELESRAIAFGPVVALDQVLADPQLQSRAMAVGFASATGEHTFVRQPLLIDAMPSAIARGVPQLGQHNAELLGPAPLAVV